MSLTKLLNRLATKTVPAIIKTASRSQIDILRATKTDTGRGATVKKYTEVNTMPIDCLYEILSQDQMARIVGEQSRPLIAYRFTIPVTTDVQSDDRIRLHAHGHTEMREMPILTIGEPSGVVMQIICAFEDTTNQL